MGNCTVFRSRHARAGPRERSGGGTGGGAIAVSDDWRRHSRAVPRFSREAHAIVGVAVDEEALICEFMLTILRPAGRPL